MPTKEQYFTSTQRIYDELLVGTLIYAVLIGFLNDYTSIVYARSFSTIFFAAVILEILTYLTLLLKARVMTAQKNSLLVTHKAALLFIVWLILFLSKFIFVWVIDILFGDSIVIYGFFGIMLLVLGVTAIHKIADAAFVKLGTGRQ